MTDELEVLAKCGKLLKSLDQTEANRVVSYLFACFAVDKKPSVPAALKDETHQ